MPPLPLTTSISAPADTGAVPGFPCRWEHSFPTRELVRESVALFPGHRIPEVNGRLVVEHARVGEVVGVFRARKESVDLTTGELREAKSADEVRQELRDWMRAKGYVPDELRLDEVQPALLQHGVVISEAPPRREVTARPIGDTGRPARDRSILGDLPPRAAGGSTEAAIQLEGPRWRFVVSPGSVQVRYSDPARAYRTAERESAAAVGEWRHQLGDSTARPPAPEVESRGGAVITCWSKKSRRNMSEVLNSLDWTPMFAEGRPPVMVTLGYPGDWLAVAPNAAACRRHLLMFRKRYERAWGRKMIGAWKREFQRRGAPHWHLVIVPPLGRANGLPFREWLSKTWADIVGAQRCSLSAEDCARGCEYHRHLAAGTGVDLAKGAKAVGPGQLAAYFSKHGLYSAKDYQNEVPAAWLEAGGSIGRFWGVWGLEKALAGVYVSPDEELALARTMRRYDRAKGRTGVVEVWRYRTVRYADDAGRLRSELRWRKARTRKRLWYVRSGLAGSLAVPDGPAFASQLSRYLDQLSPNGRGSSGSGSGPVGFLP